MASNKLVALLFALAAVAAATAVQPSEARTIQGLGGGADQVLRPTTFHNTAPSPGSPGGVVPPQPTTASAPPPPPPALTECMTPLIGMVPCMDYLTNITVLTPPAACCDGLKAVIRDAPICLCHGMNGGMNSLIMPRHIDPVRMIILPLTCGALLPLQTLLSCNSKLHTTFSCKYIWSIMFGKGIDHNMVMCFDSATCAADNATDAGAGGCRCSCSVTVIR